MRYLSQLTKQNLEGKTCLLRINLDIQDPTKDALRLNAALPTINFLLNNGAKILILSHRGRPQEVDPSLSLEPLVNILSEKIGRKLEWLENLRFNPREQQNDEGFAKMLAEKGDLYVNDDFAVSHRANASVVAITKFLPSYAGLLLEKEIKNLSKIIESPERPLVFIIGGIKINDKVGMIEYFMDKADYFLMGSAYIDLANPLLKHPKVLLPTDWKGENDTKLDIGPQTIQNFSQIINSAKTIIWNGPMGLFQDPRYLDGSKAIATAIVHSGAFSIVGGGDTNQLLNQLGLEEKFSFVSTGGGAMLEFLSGKKLSALEALEKS